MPSQPSIDGADTPDEETLLFEAEVLRRVVGPTAVRLQELIRQIIATIAGTESISGPLTEPQSAAAGIVVARAIRSFVWQPMRLALGEAAREAHYLGVQRAARLFADPEDRAKAATVRTPRRIRVSNVDASLRVALLEAERIARQGIRTQADAAAVAGRISAGKSWIEGSARATANHGINAGTAAVARRMRLRLIWVAERNACLDCLAHAGYVVEPGDLFPPLSFDPRARRVLYVEHPPLHPSCRCQARTTDAPAGAPSGDRSRVDPAARLAAEARRSVVYQWTAYESNAAMARAAEALLRAGAGLPASVEKRAERMLRDRRRQKK